jgi:hypothetical protein
MTLRDIDDRARKPGMKVCTLEEALEFLRASREETLQE